MLSRKIERKVKHIKHFEKQWKIKTNTNKFKLLPIAIKKTLPVTIDNEAVVMSKHAKILGLTLSRHGYNKHVTEIKNKANVSLSTIRRFHHLKSNIKLHLVKVCILPILTYPTYPLNYISKTSVLALQRIQNRFIRLAFNEKYPYTKTTEELHQLAKVNPINTTLYERGNIIKNKLLYNIKDPTYIDLITNHEDTQDHNWFRKPISILNKDKPPPIFTTLAED